MINQFLQINIDYSIVVSNHPFLFHLTQVIELIHLKWFILLSHTGSIWGLWGRKSTLTIFLILLISLPYPIPICMIALSLFHWNYAMIPGLSCWIKVGLEGESKKQQQPIVFTPFSFRKPRYPVHDTMVETITVTIIGQLICMKHREQFLKTDFKGKQCKIITW